MGTYNRRMLTRVPPDRLLLRPFDILDNQWALLVAGRERPNPMTVSWGGLGTIWNKPVATVYVRPTRFTFGLLDDAGSFTLNVLPEARRPALDVCGAVSGRDTDKWREAGLAPVASEAVPVPRVAGAELALECRVLASFDLDPARFSEPWITDLYPKRDFHRVFIGEVLAAWAEPRYVAEE